MLEPDLYIFKVEGDDWSLEGKGQGKLEWHTPYEFLQATPLVVDDEVTWGSTNVTFAHLVDDDSGLVYYALVERIEEDGRPCPQWAIVMINEADYPLFQEKFREYCEG